MGKRREAGSRRKRSVNIFPFLWVVLMLTACGGKGAKVPLESISVGGIFVGMDKQAAADLTGCKWESYAGTALRGPTSFVCPDGELKLDLQPMGLDANITARTKVYARVKSTKVSGFAVSMEPPPILSLDALTSALVRYYEKAIGKPPEQKGNTYNWRVGKKTFFIQLDEENSRVLIATFPQV